MPIPARPPTPAPISPTRHASVVYAQIDKNHPNPATLEKKQEQIERATSPVDERILKEFYADRPKEVHQYSLEGKQYIVIAQPNLTDIDQHRKGK